MKYLIPAAAILALGVCALSRGKVADFQPVRQAAPTVVDVAEASGVAGAGRDSRPSATVVQAAAAPASVERPASSAVLPAPGPDLLQTLRDRLVLTPAQEGQIAESLRTRAKELQECQDGWRKLGVFVPREYGAQLSRMKETWYRRIDQVLDSEQHREFDGLVAEGYFRPGTDFSVDLLTMSVIR